jgi:hypothetical protein
VACIGLPSCVRGDWDYTLEAVVGVDDITDMRAVRERGEESVSNRYTYADANQATVESVTRGYLDE